MVLKFPTAVKREGGTIALIKYCSADAVHRRHGSIGLVLKFPTAVKREGGTIALIKHCSADAVHRRHSKTERRQ
ncbi:MAG: hypothetical protein AMJ89_03865 [candidate division Zixibacteria bacterium SM23_73]|nr:MAG: hypothetical protein AMJ89_03865 [candidate division Zixibacteria bacterium SM23_73]